MSIESIEFKKKQAQIDYSNYSLRELEVFRDLLGVYTSKAIEVTEREPKTVTYLLSEWKKRHDELTEEINTRKNKIQEQIQSTMD